MVPGLEERLLLPNIKVKLAGPVGPLDGPLQGHQAGKGPKVGPGLARVLQGDPQGRGSLGIVHSLVDDLQITHNLGKQVVVSWNKEEALQGTIQFTPISKESNKPLVPSSLCSL